jgi:hypothetical protein
MKDLTVTLEDKPGALADVGEVTGGANVNIEGMCATTGGGRGEIHLLVEDPAAIRAALEGAGMEVSGERDVLVVGEPGTRHRCSSLQPGAHSCHDFALAGRPLR